MSWNEFPPVYSSPGSTRTAKSGETYTVYGYEKHDKNIESDSYTWYQIGYNMWIADDGTWLTFTPNE